MKITDRVYWVGSGAVGLSNEGDCHVYVIEGDESLAMIDCGLSVNPAKILDNMAHDGLAIDKLTYCLLTHAHNDHASACNHLKALGVKIGGSELTGTILKTGAIDFYQLNSSRNWLTSWENMPLSDLDIILADKQQLSLGDVTLTAIYTPGHSIDSVCYLAEMPDGRRELFSGDTVFYKGFISVLSPPLNDLQNYPKGLSALSGLQIDGLFPSHLMWVLKNGQQFIDIANNSFRDYKMPVNKPFS